MNHQQQQQQQRVTTATALSREEFLKLFSPEAQRKIIKKLDGPQQDNRVLGVVCMENLQYDSSDAGHRTALIYGPGYTCETLDAALDAHLGDAPSRFQYPVHYYAKT